MCIKKKQYAYILIQYLSVEHPAFVAPCGILDSAFVFQF